MTKIIKINEKAKSKSQQRLFGMVTAYKKGNLELDELSDSLAKKIKSIANGSRKKTGDKRKKTKSISKKKAKEFASTKHKSLPEKFDEKILLFSDFINESNDEIELKDALSVVEIAKKHDVPLEYLESILPKAVEIEMEHSDDPDVALEIVLHHLEETPVYYDDKIGLPNMEEELEDLEDEDIEDIVNDEKIVRFDDFENDEEDEEV